MRPVRVIGARLCDARGRLAGPIDNATRSWTERRGLLLVLYGEDDLVGVGEASPLPGFSPDTLEQCAAELAALDWAEIGALVPEDIPALLARVRAPAARFAVETALLDVIGQGQGQRAGVPVARLLAGSPRPRAPLGAMISDLGTAEAAAARAWARGIRSIKLKIGRPGRFDAELAVLRALRDRHAEALELRLDANRAWSVAEAAEKLARLVEVAPAYVEEPAQNLAALAGSPVPLAADESLADMLRAGDAGDSAIDALLARGIVSTLVLKPMLLGGAFRCLELAGRAASHGVAVVISHLLDGPVALAACAQLALAVQPGAMAHGPTHGPAHGIDRHAGLDAWPAIDLPMLEPTVVVAHGPGLGIDSAHIAALPALADHGVPGARPP